MPVRDWMVCTKVAACSRLSGVPASSQAQPRDSRSTAQRAGVQIEPVEVGDLQLAARRGPDRARQVADLRVVEIQAGHRPVGLRRGRLLHDLDRAAGGVERHHAVAFRIAHLIGEHRRAVRPRRRRAQQCGQMVGVDQVVAERQRAGLAGDPVAADQEGLRDALGPRLLGIGEAHAEARAVAQQAAELRQVLGRGDHQDVADAGQHQRRQRVVDHRLVVDRQQLLRRRQRHRMQPRAGAAGEQDALHAAMPCLAQPLAGVAGGAHRLPPGAVRQIPVDGARQPGLEVVRRASSRAPPRLRDGSIS